MRGSCHYRESMLSSAHHASLLLEQRLSLKRCGSLQNACAYGIVRRQVHQRQRVPPSGLLLHVGGSAVTGTWDAAGWLDEEPALLLLPESRFFHQHKSPMCLSARGIEHAHKAAAPDA